MTTATRRPTAEAVLETLHLRMRTPPPPGFPAEYIDGFFTRNRAALLQAMRARLEQLGFSAKLPAGPTAWGGQRGLIQLAPHQLLAGGRVVVLNALLEWVHGTIVELPRSARRVRLDSGSESWFPGLWPEVAPPTEVPRDTAVGTVEGEDYGVVHPFDLWKRIRALVRQSLRDRQMRIGGGENTQRKAVALWGFFQSWLTARGRRPQWLSWSRREIRLLELWSSDGSVQDRSPEKLELDWLLQLPGRYQERFLPGDQVRFVRFGGEGNIERGDEIPVERMTTSGVVYRREVYPYHALEPLSTDPGMNTCLPPFEEPVRPIQLFELLKRDGWDWTEISPAQLHAWIDRYLQEHRVEAHVQLLGETGGRIRLEPIDSRYDARYLPRETLNQVFLYLPAVQDDGIELDVFQEEDIFDDTLPHLRRPVQVHPAFVPSLARALVMTALEHNLPLNPSLRRCLPQSDVMEGEETASGGRRGAQVVYSPLHKMNGGYRGMRVATPEGLHGRIAWSTQHPGKEAEKAEVFHVRLDSGREEDHERVYLETARPRTLVPDVRVGGRYVAPREVWETVSLKYFQLIDHAGQPRRRVGGEVREARELLRIWYPTWHSWRGANPTADIPGFDAQADAAIGAFMREQPGTVDSLRDSTEAGDSSSSG